MKFRLAKVPIRLLIDKNGWTTFIAPSYLWVKTECWDWYFSPSTIWEMVGKARKILSGGEDFSWERLFFFSYTLKWSFIGFYIHKSSIWSSFYPVTIWVFKLSSISNCTISVSISLRRICCHNYTRLENILIGFQIEGFIVFGNTILFCCSRKPIIQKSSSFIFSIQYALELNHSELAPMVFPFEEMMCHRYSPFESG